MIIVHVVEPFATGVNTFIHELVFGMPNDEHIIIHGERDDNRNIEELKEEYHNKARFIKWEHAHREINIKQDIKALIALNKILKNIPFNILHLHSSKAGVIGGMIGFYKSLKCVVYTPNAAAFLRTDIPDNQIKRYERIEKFFSLFKTKIISSSRSEYDAYAQLKIKTKIIQNGVNIQTNNQQVKNNNVFNIVTCGKITTQKDPLFFNEIASFFKDDPSINFTWIGDGKLKSNLKNVTITGWSSKEKVYQYLSEADLYISTSLWEGLPFAGIEAMAFGLPLLLRQCVGNKDLINSGLNGYSFDSKVKAIEQIEYLKENKEHLLTLGENSKKMYHRHYENYRCAKEYKSLYDAICRKLKNGKV